MLKCTQAALCVASAIVATGCVDTETKECAWGLTCPSGYVCHAQTRDCVRSAWVKACNGRAEEEFCEFPGSTPDHRCRKGVCAEPFCGDGVLDDGEICDDGDRQSNDGCSDSCRPESAVWRELAPAGSPPCRYYHALAYDSARDRVVLFGGLSGEETYSDTWEYDGAAWVEITTSHSPPQRWGHAMVYDTARQRMVMFGGVFELYDWRRYDDTWEYDGNDWTEISPETSPAPRGVHGMAYDEARDRVVLFGGYVGLEAVDDTWEYNGNTWNETTPENSPLGRVGPTMAYDVERGRTALFGGAHEVGGDGLEGTWEYDGNDWIETAPEAEPDVRYLHGLVYHPGIRRMVLFGGTVRDASSGANNPAADTWEYDGNEWTRRMFERRPSPRTAIQLTYDSARRQIVMFGGADYQGCLSDTWAYLYEDTASTCGNGDLDSGEGCDGDNFGGLNCWQLGFTGGNLACTAECRIDFSDCSVCGNGLAESGESCDATDLSDQTCESLDFAGGQLACHDNCEFDVSGCTN